MSNAVSDAPASTPTHGPSGRAVFGGPTGWHAPRSDDTPHPRPTERPR